MCDRCHNEPLIDLLNYLPKGRGKTVPSPKLEVHQGDQTRVAVNDVVMRHAHPTPAIRFKVAVNGPTVEEQVISDGIVTATSFSATGYFRSVTRQ